GNEHRRWHDTRRVCNLGDKRHTQFCSSPTCSLCSTIRTSYDISLWGKQTDWGRYLFLCMLSNDHSNNDCKSSLRAILLNKVVVGKGLAYLTRDQPLIGWNIEFRARPAPTSSQNENSNLYSLVVT
ncbi:hypothetical protein M413DRAFT_74649, partial [Hebeloma cylindrosporum]